MKLDKWRDDFTLPRTKFKGFLTPRLVREDEKGNNNEHMGEFFCEK